MRVNQSGNNPVQGAEVSNAAKTERAQKAQAKRGAQQAGGAAAAEGAKAQISTKGKEFARAKEVATSAPDVREERIAELKRRIAAGKYQVDANAVADRMVDEHLKTAGPG
jgi:negative regulator of flagellin synthesis FlgM